MKRILVVDALRGLAIILMLLQHFPLYLMRDVLSSGFYAYTFLVSRLSAPLFFMLVGYCIVLSARKRIASAGRKGFLKHIMMRGVSIFMLGFLINVFRLDDFFAMNVIHHIGFSILVCGLLYLSGSKLAYFTTLGLLLFYCFLNPEVYSQILVKAPMDFIVWFMNTGEYSISAWIIYFIIGLGVGWFSGHIRFPLNRMIFIGYGLLSLSLVLVLIGYLPDLTANTPPFLFYILGSLAILYGIIANLSRFKYTASVINFMAAYGRHSLRVYVAHQFLLIFIPSVIGVQNTLNVYGVSLVFLVFLAAAYLAINKHEAYRLQIKRETIEYQTQLP